MKANDIIPQGMYCYSRTDDCVNMCPYWSFNKDMPEQENGFCSFIGKGDWSLEGHSLLWDQVKECGINETPFDYDTINKDGAT